MMMMSSFCLSSSNAPFPLFSRTLDRIRTAQYETNDTHFLHELPISALHELLFTKNSTIKTSFTAILFCLHSRLNRKFTVTKGLSKNRELLSWSLSFLTVKSLTSTALNVLDDVFIFKFAFAVLCYSA